MLGEAFSIESVVTGGVFHVVTPSIEGIGDMDKFGEQAYWVPDHVREYLKGLGFHLPLEVMEGHIRAWHSWLGATGDFYDYHDRDGLGRVYEVHRRSTHPAMRVCNEWGSLLLNDKTQVVCDSQECTDWLSDFFKDTGFMPQVQSTVVRYLPNLHLHMETRVGFTLNWWRVRDLTFPI